MKKLHSTLLLTLLLCMFCPKAHAYNIEVANADGVTIYYNYINNGTELEVTYRNTNYNSYSGVVNIPDEVTYMNRTRKVTSIGNHAFSGCSRLTSVTIPNSVTSIGDYAFSDCRSLTSITIPNCVTSIEEWAFYGCSSLTSVTIPNSVTSIGQGAFGSCTSLTSVTIPNSVTSIGNYAFSMCSRLTSITIPNSVTNIESRTFGYCSSLTSVTIPNSVTSIGQDAFGSCTSLTSVTIGSGVTSIGEWAFAYCDIPEVISKIENPFDIDANTFSNITFRNATLYVPVGTIDKYKATGGWKKFAFIEEGTGGDTPAPKKCEKPTISYSKGKLTFNTATEGATCQSTITDADITSYSSNEVQLGVTYHISVYATKAGYENSETATATLSWIDVEPKSEGLNGVATVRATPVLIQSNGGVLSIQGIDEGTLINVYDLSGRCVGSATATAGITTIGTTVQDSETVIVKVGDKAMKVMMK